MAESAIATIAVLKIFHNFKANLLDRHEYHLRDAFSGLDYVGFSAPVPARDIHLPLII